MGISMAGRLFSRYGECIRQVPIVVESANNDHQRTSVRLSRSRATALTVQTTRQHAPRLRRTAGTVERMIHTSSRIERFSM